MSPVSLLILQYRKDGKLTVDRKIIDTIPDNKPPQVTFTCSASGAYSNSSTPASSVWPNSLINPLAEGDALGECKFQFWVDRIESFYCNLQGCSWDSKDSFGELFQVDRWA